MKIPQIKLPFRKRGRLDQAKDAATKGTRWLRRLVRAALLWIADRLDE